MKKQFTELIGVCFTLVLLLIGTSGVQAQYCDVDDGGNTTDDWLAGVEFAGIDNESGSTVYTDYTDISGVVVPGQTYPFTATIGNSATWDQYVTVFIDWNGDESWNNEDERYDIGNCASNNCTVTADILVPAGLPSGEVRMRVIENYFSAVPDACTPGTYSETEDYTLQVQGDGSCQLPIFSYDVIDDCEAFTYSVTATLTDFNENTFITISMVRSDDVEVDDVTLPFVLEGQTVNVIENLPFGVSVSATISAGPDCSTSRSWSEIGLCPPPNNECVDAIAIACGETSSGSTENASPVEGFAPEFGTCGTTYTGAPAVWYEFTHGNNALVDVSLAGSSYDTKLFVVSGTCEEFACLAGNDDSGGLQSALQFEAEENETYYIIVTGYAANFGDYELAVDCQDIFCIDPELTVSAVDADGLAIEGCLDVTEGYRVEVSLTGGEGNATYTVTAGDSTATMASGETHIFGIYAPGTTVNVTVVGDEDPLCGTSGSVSTEVCPPENDSCADAVALECGVPVFGTTIGAELDATCGFAGVERQGVWYTFTQEGPNVVSLETCFEGTNFDTDISVFTGDDCDNLSCFTGFSTDGFTDGVFACEFAGFAAGGADAVFNAEGGVTYYILVSGFNTGNFELLASCEPILCETPELTTSIVDAEGNGFEGCQEPGTEFYINVDLAGGSGNATYTVSATLNFATVSEVVDADGSVQFGPYTAGAVVDIAAIGIDDDNCEVFGIGSLDVCPPPNDLCSEALPLPCNGSYIGNTVGGTDDLTCNFGNVRRGVWFVYTAGDDDIQVSMETCHPGTNFDTDLSVFTGADCDNLECFTGFSGDGYIDGESGCTFAGFAAGGPDATFTAAAGETYYILLSGFGTTSFGDYELHVTCQNLACTPTVTATPVADAEGTPLEDCVPEDGEYYVSVELEGGSDTELYQLSVNGVDAGAPVSTGTTTVVGPVAALETANILAIGTDDETCSGAGSTFVSDICPPANDLPCDALPLAVDGVPVSGTNINANGDAGEPNVTTQASVWYTIVGPESGRVNITTCSANTTFDTRLSIQQAGVCDDYSTYTQLAYNDDSACEFSGLQSTIEVCVEPGETYYVQVSGFGLAEGVFDITATEVDGGVCNCVLPDLGPSGFTFASTFPFCDDIENPGYTLEFYTPEDLGSSELMIYTYTIDGEEFILEMGPGETVVLETIFAITDIVAITVDISDSDCVGADGSIYPLSGSVTQPDEACDPDCEGVPGGPALPGTPCTTDADGPGTYDVNCICQDAPENNTCDIATPIACGDELTGTLVNASLTENCNSVARETVWYVYEAETDGPVELTTCVDGTTLDTDISMYTGPSCDELTCFTGWGGFGYIDGASDCPVQGFASSGVFEAVAGETYYIAVHPFSLGDVGEFAISLLCADEASISGTVANACGERDVTLSFYEAGTDVMAYSYTTDMVDGSYSVADVATGTWDIIVKVDGALANGFAGVEIVTGDNLLELGTVVLGDINNDNSVNILDVSLLNGSFGAVDGDANFNALADMNCDGGITIIDVSFVNAGFNQNGESAPIIE